MDVFFYGRLAERIGRQVRIDVPAAGCSVADLRQLIAGKYPEVETEILGSRVRACVEDTVAPDAYLIGAGQRVEFFPPVSGG